MPCLIDPNHFWQGWYMGVLSIIINEERFEKELAPKGVKMPETWDDLLDPNYKDVFVWANPTTAGGAYIATACQIFRLGEDAAWDYLKARIRTYIIIIRVPAMSSALWLPVSLSPPSLGPMTASRSSSRAIR